MLQKKSLTRCLAFVLAVSVALMCLTAFSLKTVSAEEATAGEGIIDLRDYLFEVSDDMDDEEYIWTVEKNYRVIKNFQPIFTEDSFKAFNKQHRTTSREYAQKCNDAIDLLVQKISIADGIWYIWDEDNMPMLDGEEVTPEMIDEQSKLDYAEFIPFIIKYLQEDQSTVKGNLIMCSGGGYESRGNPAEGYPAAEVFTDLGYNVFLLQRRIAPYSKEDIWMDMQRAIKMVRYYAEKEGYGGQDMFAGIGWSGGGGTLLGAMEYLSGTLTPADVFDPDYVPDEIDSVTSDLDVAMPIYGAGSDDAERLAELPYLPAFYLCAGEADVTFAENSTNLYNALVEMDVPSALFIVPGAEHGFGPGGGSKGGTGSEDWPNQADALMQENLGRSTK